MRCCPHHRARGRRRAGRPHDASSVRPRQHAALTAIQGSLGAEERCWYFLTICMSPLPFQTDCGTCTEQCSKLDALPHSHQRRQNPSVELWWSATQLYDTLERIHQATDPEACVWRGSGLPTEQIGIRMLGAHPSATKISSLPICRSLRSHQTLLERSTSASFF